MLSTYLNQTATYKPLLSHTNRGEPVYGEEASVKCRREEKTQEIITPDKRTVKTEFVYYLTTEVKEGDLLDSRIVAFVEKMVAINGAIWGYKAVL